MINWVFQKPKGMNFILYVKCIEKEDFGYHNPFYEVLRKEIPNSDFLDLDNFSGRDLINMAETAIQKADKTCIIFDLHTENGSNNFLKLTTYLADNPKDKMVFINGKDGFISKLLPVTIGFSYHELSQEDQLRRIKEFINS